MVKVVGWNKGSPNEGSGAGYGIRIIDHKDRDRYFERKWATVIIEFDNGTKAEVRVSDSFWRNCIELRNKEIGKWMLENNLAPWNRGSPPTMELKPLEKQRYRLTKIQ